MTDFVSRVAALARVEQDAIETALRGWIEASGRTPEQWAERYGLEVVRRWDGFVFRVTVSATREAGQLNFREISHG